MILLDSFTLSRSSQAQREAITTVQSLLILSGPVTDGQLAAAGHLLTRREYEEVEEERAIAGDCGYPCCSNRLPRDYANSVGRFKVGLGDQKIHKTQVNYVFKSWGESCTIKSYSSESPPLPELDPAWMYCCICELSSDSDLIADVAGKREILQLLLHGQQPADTWQPPSGT